MRVGRILSIVVVSLASIIVIGAGAIALSFFARSSSAKQRNFAPPEGQQAISPVGNIVLLSQTNGNSSFLYRKNPSDGTSVRLTSASVGIESEASFSHNGKLVVYSFANSPDSKSAVWVVGAGGSTPHALTGKDEDALHPVFSADDSKVFYAASSFTGHYSPVVRPARHDWDLFSIPVQSSATTASIAPTQITHASFYDLQSLDFVADPLNQGGIKLLISTTGYPIGALLEEFNLGASGRDKIFQPHVAGESSVGPSYGEARFIHDGMDILFLAATDTSGGDYDYNVYSMSDVTGSDIKQLTHLRGVTRELKVLPNGRAAFVNGGMTYVLDINTQALKPL
jgi:Tol biopolymer transport system component